MKKARFVELNPLVQQVRGQLRGENILQFGQRAATQITKQPVSQFVQDARGQLRISGSNNWVTA